MKVNQVLEDRANQQQDKTAIVFKDESISFKQLRDRSFSLANSLISAGIQKGDKVAVYLPNSPEYVYSYLAIWSIGAVIVPLDYMLTDDELISCISHSEAKLLIARDKPIISLDKIKEGCSNLGKILLAGELISLDIKMDNPKAEVDDKDLAIIFYTSGTTGKPKGVMINYQQLGAPPKSMEAFVDLNENDVTICALPFSHLGGLIYIQNCISFGITVVLMERFIPPLFLRNVQQFKATCFWVVPSMYYALLHLKEFESFDLSSLRWIVTFGASSSPDALRRFNQFCPNAHILNGWGLTETNAPTTVTLMGSKKIESVGRPAPWIEVKIHNDQDEELSVGNVGEIVVRGWVVTEGYYKDPKLTQETIRDGWFHTGDLGKFDEEGDLYIVGRKKEMIKVAGEIVFEPEVEATIHKHPEIAEVAVVGVKDELRGEVPKAFVVLKENSTLTDHDLKYFCREHLAHFKIPHYFEFKESLPKNRTGKINKELLRQ